MLLNYLYYIQLKRGAVPKHIYPWPWYMHEKPTLQIPLPQPHVYNKPLLKSQLQQYTYTMEHVLKSQANYLYLNAPFLTIPFHPLTKIYTHIYKYPSYGPCTKPHSSYSNSHPQTLPNTLNPHSLNTSVNHQPFSLSHYFTVSLPSYMFNHLTTSAFL